MATPLALVWDLIAKDSASPAFTRVSAAADKTAESTGRAAAATEGASKRMGHALVAMGKGAAIVAAVVGVESLKMAGDFQFQMNRMVTAAGESRKNLKQVSDGVLNLMASTGTSAKNLEAGLYLIESAGFHGKSGLDILAVAAKGAKIENAGLAEVANAVTSAMVDYHVKASDSAAVMNTLIAGVAHGKTTLAELSTAFSNVGAAGASAHVPMADLTAALATMTMHGTDAAKAGTYLRQTIGQLEGPSAGARDMMKGLGLDANQVGLTLSSGPGGLARAIQMLDDAISQHLTPSGLVAVEMFKKSHGTLSDYQKVLANIPPDMITTFGALAKMTGGVKSLQGFLQLGGENLKTFRSNTLAVNEAVKAGGKNVEGWSSTQKQFNTVLDQVRGQLDKWLIQLGMKLIPLVEKAIGWIKAHKKGFEELGRVVERVAVWAYKNLIQPALNALIPIIKSVAGWVEKHKKGLEQLAHVLGVTLAFAFRIALDLFKALTGAVRVIFRAVSEFVGVVNSLGDAFHRIGEATGIIKAWNAMRPIFVAMKAFIDDIRQGMIDIGLIGETVQGHGSLAPGVGGTSLGGHPGSTWPGGSGLLGGAPYSGGTGYAAHATGGRMSAGWNLLGEQGPELYNRDTGQILTASQTAQRGATHQSVTVNQTINTIIPVSPGISGPAGMRKAAAAFR